ncbi:enoyl-CoA hydratase-related protein [Nocardia sp. CA-290969]|uniref:enoyl-CoA hydratase-related protein n=1 Tax=Nocardia sp. CA-290969 TaxID=3239986 RepID=UPI003D8C9614
MSGRTVSTEPTAGDGARFTSAAEFEVALELELSPAGVPARPLILLDLDGLRESEPAEITRFAQRCRESVAPVVGVLGGAPEPRLRDLVRALTFTLTRAEYAEWPELVVVGDLDTAVGHVWAAVQHNPQAAIACARLLRQTPGLDTTDGLAAEAAVFSMLLAGREFRRWLDDRGTARPVAPPPGDLVRAHRDGTRYSVVLDHPRRRNALSFRLREDLLAALLPAQLDPTITEVELSGAGPSFCSGGDLAEFGTSDDPVAAYLARLDRAPWRVMDRIADRLTVRMHGGCIGAGAEMAAFGGTVVAAPSTFIAFPEVAMGLIPGAGGTVSVTRRIGRWRAAWLMLTGSRIDAETTLRWGLVDRIAGAAQ